MNKTKQRQVLKNVKKFIVDTLGKEEVTYMQFLTGDEAIKYSEYATEDSPYISFDGSIVYRLLNYGEDRWQWMEKFDAFLKEMGMWYEQGHAWNLSIYED